MSSCGINIFLNLFDIFPNFYKPTEIFYEFCKIYCIFTNLSSKFAGLFNDSITSYLIWALYILLEGAQKSAQLSFLPYLATS